MPLKLKRLRGKRSAPRCNSSKRCRLNPKETTVIWSGYSPDSSRKRQTEKRRFSKESRAC